MPDFVHLHNHSEYSLLDGAQTTEEMAKHAVEIGAGAIALTDHGKMGGLLSFYNNCRNNDVKPILGMEAYITAFGKSRRDRTNYQSATKEFRGTPGYCRNNYHIILLCKDYRGYQNLCRLSKESYENGYYYKPRIDYDLLKECHEGLIASSACIIGQVSNLLLNNDYDGARRVATWMKDVFGEDYYLEIMNHGLDIEQAVMRDIRSLGKDLDIPVIATNDAHYSRREMHKLQKSLMLIGMHKSWSDRDVKGSFFRGDTTEYIFDDYSSQDGIADKDSGETDPIFETKPELYLKTYDEMLEAMRINGGENGVAERELAMTAEVAAKCNCELPIIDDSDLSQYHFPVFDVKKDFSYQEYSKAGDFEIPEHTKRAIVHGFATNDSNDRTITDDTPIETILDGHEMESLRFITWKCEKNFDKLIIPKVKAKGEPLPVSYWASGDTEGLSINHAHNSPDELWLKEQFANGNTEDDIFKMYRDRLDFELSIIAQRRFLDYFEIVQQYCNYVRNNGSQVGAGRGSGAGALINYLLGITAIDPLPNNLLFGRFLSLARIGAPDIDCDFVGEFRDRRLWPYIREVYGEDCTSQVATYTVFQGKAALKAAGRVLFNPPESITLAEELCDVVNDRPKLDLNEEIADDANPQFVQVMNSSPKHRQIVELALMLQGRISGESQHASAYIVSPIKLTDSLPLMVSKDEREASQKSGKDVKNYIIQYDGREVQDLLGFIKLDLLVVKDLEVIRLALESIKSNYGIEINIENIPLDDRQVFQMIQDGHTTGLFQFDGSSVPKRILIDSGADRIADLSATNALDRPGALNMGADKEFVERKLHPEKTTYMTPYAEPYLRETYGTVCYQEQLSQLSQDKHIIGFDAGQADTLRKVTAHKDKKKIEKMVALAKETARSNNVPENIYNWFCDLAVEFGKYAFNHSHSLAYAVIAYRGGFLKAHFPEAFLSALCQIKPMMKGKDKIPDYLTEARQLGVTVKPPHVNLSRDTFSVPERGTIVFGLDKIKGVGAAAKVIIDERDANGKYRDFTDFCTRVPRSVTKAALGPLIDAGALDGLGWTRKAMHESLDQIAEFRKNWFAEKARRDVVGGSLFGGFDMGGGEPSSAMPPIDLVPPFDTEYTKGQIMRQEKSVFGMYFSGDPEDEYRMSKFLADRRMEEDYAAEVKLGHSQMARPIRVKDIASLPDRTPVELTCKVVSTRIFKSGKGASVSVSDWGVDEESRFGFSPVSYSSRLTVFDRVWSTIPTPQPDTFVHVVGKVNVDKKGDFPPSVIVDSIEQLPRDSEIYLKQDVEKLLPLQNQMVEEAVQVADPMSDRYLVPVVTFPDRESLDAFLLDENTIRIQDRRGRVIVRTESESDGGKIENLKQTMGMVHQAARFGGKAAKVRLPKAESAAARLRMMHGDNFREVIAEQVRSGGGALR